MTAYSVVVKPSVEKDLGRLPKPTVERLLRRIEALRAEPLPRPSMKLTGAEHLYRLRMGDYRIIYGVDHAARLITVHYIRHRREAYRRI